MMVAISELDWGRHDAGHMGAQRLRRAQLSRSLQRKAILNMTSQLVGQNRPFAVFREKSSIPAENHPPPLSQTRHQTPMLAATSKSNIFSPSSSTINLPSLAALPPNPPPAYSWPRERSNLSIPSPFSSSPSTDSAEAVRE